MNESRHDIHVGSLVIPDEVSAPERQSICVVTSMSTSTTGFVVKVRPLWPRYDSVAREFQAQKPTSIEAFGVKFIGNKLVRFADSVATYGDGMHRRWQGHAWETP